MQKELTTIIRFAGTLGQNPRFTAFDPRTNTHATFEFGIKNSEKRKLEFIEEFCRFLEQRVTAKNYDAHFVYIRRREPEQTTYRFEIIPEEYAPSETHGQINEKVISAIPALFKDFRQKYR